MATSTKLATIINQGSIKAAIPSTKVSEIYCEQHNTLAPLENYTLAQDVSLSFNTLNYGSTATIALPAIYKFIHHAFVKVTLKGQYKFVTSTSQGAGLHPFIRDLVGPNLFASISYQIPGMERQIIDPNTIVQRYIDQIPLESKRLALMELMGNADYVSVDGTVDAPTTFSDYSRDFFIPVPLPSTSFQMDEKQAKPLPVHMVGEPIQLMFTFNPSREILKASSGGDASTTEVTVGGTTGAVFKSIQISDAKLFFVYSNLASPAEYKQVIQKYPTDLVYHHKVPLAKLSGGASSVYNVTLGGMRQGETTMIAIKLCNSTGNYLEPFGFKLYNIKLNYAGYPIYQSDEATVEYFNILSNENITKMDLRRADRVNLDYKASNRTHWYNIPIAAKTVAVKGAHNYVLGADFNNAELKLSFSIHPDDIAKTSDPLVLHVDSYVTSILQFNGQTATLIQ